MSPQTTPATFTAADMRADWAPIWAPRRDSQALARAWEDAARRAGLQRREQVPGSVPDFGSFLAAVH
eukprot:1132739-Alexandrium_andersonii.AAC.1